MMKILMMMLVVGAFLPEAYAAASTEIYFVRHGETITNVTHQHSRKNDRTFSNHGEKQVAELTRELDALQFDYIIVSPKYRALNTIFPYLKKHSLVAEVWPELAECCWQEKTSRLSSFRLQRGKKIQLEGPMKRYFRFPDEAATKTYETKNYGDGLLQTFKAVQLIRKRFAGSGKRILIVGHYHMGSRLIEILQNIEPDGRYKLSNAKITQLVENSDGSFRIVRMNQ